jgi:hypothetical protein
MSLFDSASLVVTPNGQKAGKLYSIKPSDGSGDLSVVRATTATRVDANGLVEIPRTNLYLRSEEFDNASWVKTSTTVTANATTAPNGTLTADKLIASSGLLVRFISQDISLTSGVNYTQTVYVKAAEYSFFQITGSTGFNIAGYANFDLINGTVTAFNVGTATITNMGNGWYRCSYTQAAIATITGRYVMTMVLSGTSVRLEAFNGDGTSGLFIWGAQVEASHLATEYIPTVASIRTKFAGITQDGGSASNIPRLDYTNGSCPSILVEPQRTNLVAYSEQFDNAYWTGNAIVTANTTTAPDGTLTADTLNDNTTSYLDKRKLFVITGNSTYTFSFFVKKTTGALTNYAGMGVLLSGVSSRVDYGIINTTTGVIVRDPSSTINSAVYSSVSYGDYWRVIVTFTDNQLNLSCTIILYPAISSNGTTINQNAQGSNVFWGAQLEAGANATSYIPTTSASVTRNADVISKTGISSLIGQTEGTIFVDIDLKELPQSTQRFIQLKGTSFDIFIRSGAYAITGMSAISFTPITGRMKIAAIYSDNLAKLFINGIEIGSRTSVTISNTNNIGIGNDSLGGNINSTVQFNSIQLYKTALTDEQLAQLTTI